MTTQALNAVSVAGNIKATGSIESNSNFALLDSEQYSRIVLTTYDLDGHMRLSYHNTGGPFETLLEDDGTTLSSSRALSCTADSSMTAVTINGNTAAASCAITFDDTQIAIPITFTIEGTPIIEFRRRATVPSVFSYGIVTASGFTNTATQIESSVSSPTAISASQNDWSAISSTARIARISASSASLSITGLAITNTPGKRVTLINVGTNSITLTHDATSTAANRFYCPGNTNFSLRAGASVDIWYDTASSRWRVLGV